MSFISRYRNKSFESMDSIEKGVQNMPGVVLPDDSSRIRGNVTFHKDAMGNMRLSQKLAFFTTILPIIRRCIRDNKKDIESLSNDPADPETIADESFFLELEKEAKKLGASAIGFTTVPRRLIFKDKGIMYANAIVVTMEMDKDRMSKAPSFETMQNVMQTYADLGDIVVKLSDFLRKNGYGEHGSPALGGMVFYPELGQLAGMGVRGRHGLLISPCCGPRQRVAAIFTSITNLPAQKDNPHTWVRDFCAKCGKCIRQCPSRAILEAPGTMENGDIRYVDAEKCMSFFSKNYGCSICIKECPFNVLGYEKLMACRAQ